MEKSFLEYNLVHTNAGLCHHTWFTSFASVLFRDRLYLRVSAEALHQKISTSGIFAYLLYFCFCDLHCNVLVF